MSGSSIWLDEMSAVIQTSTCFLFITFTKFVLNSVATRKEINYDGGQKMKLTREISAC